MMLDVQKGIYSAITNLGYTVYDYLPTNPTFPYVLIGGDDFTSSNTKTQDRYYVTCVVNTYSRYKGMKETKEMLDKINTVMRTIDVGLEWASNYNRLKNIRILGDPDPTITHGLLEIEISLTKI